MSNTQTEIKIAKLLSAKELADMKETLGEILLALQFPLTPEERQNLWQCFELLLEQYIEGKEERQRTIDALRNTHDGRSRMGDTGIEPVTR